MTLMSGFLIDKLGNLCKSAAALLPNLCQFTLTLVLFLCSRDLCVLLPVYCGLSAVCAGLPPQRDGLPAAAVAHRPPAARSRRRISVR